MLICSGNKMLSIEFLMLLILLLVIKTINASTLPSSAHNDIKSNKCEQISITQHCRELKYNQTMVSSIVNGHHMNIDDANEMIIKLRPVFEMTNSHCSRQIRFLICSSLFPWCSDEIPRPVMACRNVCEKVKSDCFQDPIIKLWPHFLDCEQLPQPEKQELCMTMPDEAMIDDGDYNSENQTKSVEENDHEVVQTKYNINNRPQQATFWWKLTQSHQMYNKVSTLSTCPQNFTIDERGNCVYKCGTDAFYTTHQKKVIETCILVFSVLCFIFTLFSLITFWTESTRFKFPERPVLFLTLCYNLLSICYLLKIFYQKSSVKLTIDELNEFNDISAIKTSDMSASQCVINSQCLAYFIIINYLMISASFWWFIFGLCWWLSTSKQWSPEALERKSGLFHVLAWLVPLASPIAALLFGVIKKTELTGMCTAVGFTEIPSLILLSIGAIFIVLSAKSLRSLRSSWKNNKLSQVMSRILFFGTIFVIPAIISTVLMFFDYDVDLRSCLPGEVCYQPEKRSINITIIRYACLLIGGISGMWVWSKKTCVSCRKKITASQYSNPSPQTTIESMNGFSNKYTYKYVHSIQKSLLNNNYYLNHNQKKFTNGVHRTHEHIDWIAAQNRI
ncbi:CLUMA_CG003269, isoform A [Clunio marinus]|uniref:CLUMA_CG003269, isoform A n=1 Tax=Clunio marinus TaxID=568069 RepID=A0A1J1HNU1_9DIPT|nr:CLUMA_CG003269, isoform A [Clunio marinus]